MLCLSSYCVRLGALIFLVIASTPRCPVSASIVLSMGEATALALTVPTNLWLTPRQLSAKCLRQTSVSRLALKLLTVTLMLIERS